MGNDDDDQLDTNSKGNCFTDEFFKNFNASCWQSQFDSTSESINPYREVSLQTLQYYQEESMGFKKRKRKPLSVFDKVRYMLQTSFKFDNSKHIRIQMRELVHSIYNCCCRGKNRTETKIMTKKLSKVHKKKFKFPPQAKSKPLKTDSVKDIRRKEKAYFKANQKREYRFSMVFPTIVDIALSKDPSDLMHITKKPNKPALQYFIIEAKNVKIPGYNIGYIDLLNYLKNDNSYYENNVAKNINNSKVKPPNKERIKRENLFPLEERIYNIWLKSSDCSEAKNEEKLSIELFSPSMD